MAPPCSTLREELLPRCVQGTHSQTSGRAGYSIRPSRRACATADLDLGLAALLVYVGVKMYYQGFTDEKIPIAVSLPIIAAVIGIAILASWLRTRNRPREAQ
jgi:hypothetical protein